jgi:hypothetical protein
MKKVPFESPKPVGGIDFIIKIKGKKYYMESPVQNFMAMLKAAMTYASPYTGQCEYADSTKCKNISNTARSACSWFSYYQWYNWMSGSQPAAGTSTYGIQIGSNDTAVVITDYHLNTQIAHGSGAGQMLYGAQTITTGGTTPNKYAKILRTFTNNTANPIDVKECGLVVNPYCQGIGNDPIMITRDVISPTITVAAADTLPLEIYLQTTA